MLGDPRDFARHYYEAGADEIMYMDVVASLYNRNSLHSLLSATAREIAIPLLVGGGLRTIEDIESVLRAGADRVSLNTAAVKNPEIIRAAANKFGSSTITVAIEAIKHPDGMYYAYTDNGRETTGVEVVGWARRVEELGAGEIVITSVDREGTGQGFDCDLTRIVSQAVGIPVIAHGGCAHEQDAVRVIKEGLADAVAISSVLHYDFLKRHQAKAGSTQEGNTAFITSGRSFNKISPAGLDSFRSVFRASDIACRA